MIQSCTYNKVGNLYTAELADRGLLLASDFVLLLSSALIKNHGKSAIVGFVLKINHSQI